MKKDTSSVASRLTFVRNQIADFELRHARKPGEVTLMAVSKRKPVAAILESISAGQRCFGENYVDEGVEKIQKIDDASLEWHFIGAIQSRKTAEIAENFDWAHGVDRLKIAKRLSAQRPAHKAPLNICLQLNLDNEASKAGISLQQLPELAADCAQLPGIALRGLMAIPAPRTDFSAQRQVFAKVRSALASIPDTNGQLDTLSMGMSGDLEAAVAEGATIVRVGTAIFGARD